MVTILEVLVWLLVIIRISLKSIQTFSLYTMVFTVNTDDGMQSAVNSDRVPNYQQMRLLKRNMKTWYIKPQTIAIACLAYVGSEWETG